MWWQEKQIVVQSVEKGDSRIVHFMHLVTCINRGAILHDNAIVLTLAISEAANVEYDYWNIYRDYLVSYLKKILDVIFLHTIVSFSN